MNYPDIKLYSNIISGIEKLCTVVDDLGLQTLGVVCDTSLYDSNEYVKSSIDELKNSYDVHLLFYEHYFLKKLFLYPYRHRCRKTFEAFRRKS